MLLVKNEKGKSKCVHGHEFNHPERGHEQAYLKEGCENCGGRWRASRMLMLQFYGECVPGSIWDGLAWPVISRAWSAKSVIMRFLDVCLSY